MREGVYISGLLKRDYLFYQTFSKLIHDTGLNLIELENTKDIWCRDYMPVKSSAGKNLLFNYNPSYLKGRWKHLLTPRKDLIHLLYSLKIEYNSSAIFSC
jgi:agmatine deiminase